MLEKNIKKELLSAKPFQYLDHHELDMLLDYSTLVQFSPGEIILRQGEKNEGMYIIIEGKALVTIKVLGKEVLNLATFEHGNFIGEVSLIEKCPASATVVAETSLTCLLITTSYFDMLPAFFPETHYKISKAIAEEVCYRLREIYKKIIEFITQSDMSTRSFFGEVVNTFTKPEIIKFEDAHINIHKLEHSAFFNHFTEEECKIILAHSDLIKAPDNCTLIKEGENQADYFLILFGAVQANIIQNNKVVKLSVFSPMTFFGSICHLIKSPSLLNYSTCERAILLRISEENLLLLQKSHVRLWYKIFDFMCKSLVGLERSADKLHVRLHCELYNR